MSVFASERSESAVLLAPILNPVVCSVLEAAAGAAATARRGCVITAPPHCIPTRDKITSLILIFAGRADREPAGRSQGHLPLIVDDIKLHSNCITTNTDKPFEIVSIHPTTEDNFSLSVGSTSNIIFSCFEPNKSDMEHGEVKFCVPDLSSAFTTSPPLPSHPT